MELPSVLFTRFAGDGKEIFNDIYAVDPDGKNEVRLTMNPGPTGAYADHAGPRYNRDRSMIAFVSTRNHPKGKYNIFFMDLKTRKTAQVTQGDLNISSVDWSPDDRQLVFSGCDDQGLQQVHVVNLDGTGFTKLTGGPSEHVTPMWSPRGDRIVFVEFPPKSESSSVWIMDPQGGNRRKLTVDDAHHANPSWSPDGEWIVFRCDASGPHLRKLHLETGRVVQFPPHEVGVDSSPVWSEEGIIFSSNCDWQGAEALASLYRMSSEGQLQARLTKAEVFDVCGDW
jgi:TolB protein